jgi:hypothetical protein
MGEFMRTVQWLKRRVPLFFAASAVLLLAGCASTYQYPPFPDQSKKIEDPAKARIYVIRSSAVLGGAEPVIFYGADWAATGPVFDPHYNFPLPEFGLTAGNVSKDAHLRRIGEIGPKSFICWEAPPHEFRIERVEGDTNSIYTLDLKAGSIYYLRASTKMGLTRDKSVIEKISEEEALRLLKDCNPPKGYQKRNPS